MEVLSAAKHFKHDWYENVTWTWLYTKMGLVRGKNGIRKDVREMYAYVASELKKEWPAPEPVPGGHVTTKRKRKSSAAGASKRACLDPSFHIGGQYGMCQLLGEGGYRVKAGTDVIKCAGVWWRRIIELQSDLLVGGGGLGDLSYRGV